MDFHNNPKDSSLAQVTGINQILWILLFITTLCCNSQSAFAQTTEGKDSSGRFFGSLKLLTNYVEHGFTQTDDDPALQTEVGYQFNNQGRVGVWGSNVKFASATSSEHLNLKPFFQYRFLFSPNFDLVARYSLSQYFRSNVRNGPITHATFEVFGYNIVYEKAENWEGTLDSRLYYGFEKDWAYGTEYFIRTVVGYNNPKAEGRKGFFDGVLGFGFKKDTSRIGLYASGTSDSDSGTQSQPKVWLEVQVAF